MQFGFMPRRGTIDAIFIARQFRRNTWEKRKTFTSPLLIWIKDSIEFLGSLGRCKMGYEKAKCGRIANRINHGYV